MQDFDSRPVGRHGAAGGEGDGQDGDGNHERKNDHPGSDGGLRHGPHAVDPAAMVVEGSARHLRREHFAQIGEIGRAAGHELRHDNAWDRQVAQRDA
jgi:hypothetical protein